MPKQNLILIPGLACTIDLWREQNTELRDLANVHVTDEHLRNDTLVGIAQAILASAPDRFALGGLSMGGYVALEIMRQEPKRVSGLALLDTSARSDTPEQTKRRRALIELASAEGMAAVMGELLPIMIHPSRQGDRDLVSRIMAMGEDCGVERFIMQQRAIMGRPDSRSDLRRIVCPTTVACGDADLITPPEWSEEMVTSLPNASLRMIDACGHMSSMERPLEVTEVLRRFVS